MFIGVDMEGEQRNHLIPIIFSLKINFKKIQTDEISFNKQVAFNIIVYNYLICIYFFIDRYLFLMLSGRLNNKFYKIHI